MDLIIGEGQPVQFSITIQGNRQWFFKRDNFMKLYPESFLTATLELDPLARNIELKEPCVTPTVLSILYLITERSVDQYIDEFRPIYECPEILTHLEAASRYLLIEELRLFTNPSVITMMSTYLFEELINPRPHRIYCQFKEASRWGYTVYLEYLCARIEPDPGPEGDIVLCIAAIKENHPLESIQTLVGKRRIDVSKNLWHYHPVSCNTSTCLYIACNEISWYGLFRTSR